MNREGRGEFRRGDGPSHRSSLNERKRRYLGRPLLGQRVEGGKHCTEHTEKREKREGEAWGKRGEAEHRNP